MYPLLLNYCLSPSLSLIYTSSLIYYLSLSLIYTLPLIYYLSLILIVSLTHTHPISSTLSLSLSHSISLTHFLLLSLSFFPDPPFSPNLRSKLFRFTLKTQNVKTENFPENRLHLTLQTSTSSIPSPHEARFEVRNYFWATSSGEIRSMLLKK